MIAQSKLPPPFLNVLIQYKYMVIYDEKKVTL